MKILGVRSIPLSKDTSSAWKSAGVRFAKRNRTSKEIKELVEKYDYDVVLNLGTVGLLPVLDTDVYNLDETIQAVSSTATLRKTLGGKGMPERTTTGPHWHKKGGWGGVGVEFHEDSSPCKGWPTNHEVQQHIEGTEYRVITVGTKVVQANRKVNVEWNNGKHHFDYEWCGVEGVSKNGIVPLLHSLIPSIPAYSTAVLGWDIIVGSGPYIIECNTSPGVNTATAGRIVKAIEGS